MIRVSLAAVVAILFVTSPLAVAQPPAAADGGDDSLATTPPPSEPSDAGLGPSASPEGAPPTGPSAIMLLAPEANSEVLEGSEVILRWSSVGPIERVRLYFSYDRCPLGGKPRGEVGQVLFGQMIANSGEARWTVPWVDAAGFRLRIAGYDAAGERLADDEIGVRFRPAQLKDLPDRALGIIKARQRLYYYEDGRIRRMHVVSTAAPGYNTPTMRPGSYDRRRGAMGQVFRKARSAWSRSYRVNMPYWLQITSSGSHGIHATSPRFYSRLGSGASHGCVRQHRADAAVLYEMVAVGTPVYIF